MLDDVSSKARNAAHSLVKILSPLEREPLGSVAGGESLDAFRQRHGLRAADAQQLRLSMMVKLHAEHTADAVRIAICADRKAEPLG
jgi:hypothetical protein